NQISLRGIADLEWQMITGVEYGCEHFEANVQEGRLVQIEREPQTTPLDDLSLAVTDALERPIGFPSLRRALTPDDRVAIVLGEGLQTVREVAIPLLEHIADAHVRPEAITFVSPRDTRTAEWLSDLPDDFKTVRHVVHDAEDRKQLSYL